MSYVVPDSIKCLEGLDYNVVKHNDHFEWVDESEKTILKLSLEIFENLGVAHGTTLDVAVKGYDEMQDAIKIKMDELAKQVTSLDGINELAKTIVVDWNTACKYQIEQKYHCTGDGPKPQQIRWGFESAIKYIIICATHLVSKVDNIDFKKHVSDFVKNNLVKSIIDSLENVKNELEALRGVRS